jgi:copper chaperone CopZ
MKKLSFLTVLTLVTLAVTNAFAAGEVVHVKVLGLVCDFCAKTIDKVFMDTEKVESTNVDLDKALVTINMKDGQIFDDEFIKTKITEAGYSVENIHHQPEVKND